MRAWSLLSSARHAAPTPLIDHVDGGVNGCREPPTSYCEKSPTPETTDQEISLLIAYFYQGETSLDVDNIAKSLLDGLKGVLFRDDQQVSELRVRKSCLSAGLSLTGASLYLLEAIERMSQTGSDFVYVRADPGPDHSRIP